MEIDFNSVQRSALLALRGAILRHTEHGWLAENDHESRFLSDGVVRWLFGEGFLNRAPSPGPESQAYELNSKGVRAAVMSEAAEAELQSGTVSAGVPAGTPMLLLLPADHSEELDYVLCVPLGARDIELHRRRTSALARVRESDPHGFEFIQFRDEIHALPITQSLAQADLLPPEESGFLLLEDGLSAEAGTQLAWRRCTDRGVNYGDGWVQWFGGFDRESPLIVSARVNREQFEEILNWTSGHIRASDPQNRQ